MSPPGKTAPAADLEAARATGLTALGPLAQKYPNDPAVLKALMLAHANDKAGYTAAVGVAVRLFEMTPKTAGDDDMRRMLLRILAGPPEAVATALEVLTAKMGPFGPDVLFEVMTDANAAKPLRDRAAKLLESADGKAMASPALLVAMELKAASPCARKALFRRAGSDGDGRSLPYLKPLTVTNGCTRLLFSKVDCYECLGSRSELNEAIKAIEARSPKR